MADVARLPVVTPGSLPLANDNGRRSERRQPNGEASNRGDRNTGLFDAARLIAYECGSHTELLRRLRGINTVEFTTPLPDGEVERMARKVWEYREQGHCFAPGSGGVGVTEAEGAALCDEPAALVLYGVLRRAHPPGAGRGQFPVSPIAIAQTLPGKWDAKKVRENRAKIIDVGLLTRTYQGGKGAGDPSQFAFQNKGGKSIHNSTYTPGASQEG